MWIVILKTVAVHAAPPAAAEVQLGVEYRGPKLLQVSAFGLTFTAPKGWVGVAPPNVDYFLLTSASTNGWVVINGALKTLAEVQTSMAQPLGLGNGIALMPASPLQVAQNRVTGDYTAFSNGQPLLARVVTVVSKHGVAVCISALGSPQDLPAAMAAAGVVFDSLRFSKLPQPAAPPLAAAPSDSQPGPATEQPAAPPTAPDVTQPASVSPTARGPQAPNMSGMYLRRASSQGDTGRSISLHLCSDGRFRWHTETLNMSQLGSYNGASNQYGRWQQQGATLHLDWDDNDVSDFDISTKGNSLYLGDKRWLQEHRDCTW
jgi:hypothetical protein